MKSVLVIEKPESCDVCDLCMNQVCGILRKPIITDKIYQIDDDCPLKDLPKYEIANEYNFESYKNGVAVGWNRCLEKITGEVLNYAKTKGHNKGEEIEHNKGECGE